MGTLLRLCKPVVAVFWLIAGFSLPGLAQEADIDDLLAQLADPATENWESVERRIRTEWSKSGSAAMDLLLQRGEKALETEDLEAALEHFTALTDHAPDFAEGWNARATVLFRMGLYGPAMQDLSRALALNPRHFVAMTGLAVILSEVGMKKEALEAWRLLEQVNPHRPELRDAVEALEREVGGQTL